MKAVIILLVIGGALILEAIWVIKRTSARNRAAVGGVIGAAWGAEHSKTGNRTVGALMGGAGGAALGSLYPYLGFLFGSLFLIGALILLFSGMAFNENGISDCADKYHIPKGVTIVGNWTDYRCMSKKNAGANGKYCLARNKYSQVAGMGCEGNDLCCPFIPVNSPDLLTNQDPQYESDCGSRSGSPPVGIVKGLWDQYRCRNEEQAGSGWSRCLARKQYSKTKGRGCATGMKCCPPY